MNKPAVELPAGRPWVNWVGNRSCNPRHFASPADEDHVAALVAAASAAGLGVRVAATWALVHARRRDRWPPARSPGKLSGIVGVDAVRKRHGLGWDADR